MADLVIPSGEVVVDFDSVVWEVRIAQVAVSAGELVYLSSNLANLSRANADTTDDVFGMALATVAADQPLVILRSGLVTLANSAILSLGMPVMLSAAAAGKATNQDQLVSTNYVTFLGMPTSTTQLDFTPKRTSTQIA